LGGKENKEKNKTRIKGYNFSHLRDGPFQGRREEIYAAIVQGEGPEIAKKDGGRRSLGGKTRFEGEIDATAFSRRSIFKKARTYHGPTTEKFTNSCAPLKN